ncbi:MAG: ribonuclease HII [Anaerolineaceae bacterium]
MASTERNRPPSHRTASPGLDYEIALWKAGLPHVAGLDEAGRGAWAGPVAAAAVILPNNNPDLLKNLSGVRDSKQMTAGQRTRWAERIRGEAVAFGVGLSSHEEIDRVGILRATRLAMGRALDELRITPDYLLLDAVLLRDRETGQTALIKGDNLSLTIAAASILAKTARDQIMIEIESTYPGFGFSRHKGYGTAFHQQALLAKGVCEIHRRSFRPVKVCLD